MRSSGRGSGRDRGSGPSGRSRPSDLLPELSKERDAGVPFPPRLVTAFLEDDDAEIYARVPQGPDDSTDGMWVIASVEHEDRPTELRKDALEGPGAS